MSATNVLALDVGGANVKWCAGGGEAGSIAFPVWRKPEALARRLEALCSGRGETLDALLVTMTAELCDCFATRAEGVRHVLAATERAARRRPIHVWSTSGRFVTVEQAVAEPMAVAAANWHALATWAARHFAPAPGVLVDIGSTTSDLIPLAQGRCVAAGMTDTERLAERELVYVGGERTPLMAVAQELTWQGIRMGVMAERFATMGDAMLLCDLARERPEDTDTADGRPMTVAFAAARLLRMVGADTDTHSQGDAVALAKCFVKAAIGRLAAALRHVVREYETIEFVLLSGSGEMLAQKVAERAFDSWADAGDSGNLKNERKGGLFASRPIVRRLSEIVDPFASTAACAHAMVWLWNHGCTTTSDSPGNRKIISPADRNPSRDKLTAEDTPWLDTL